VRILDGSFPAGSEAAVAQALVRVNALSATAAVSLEALGLAGTPGATSLRRRGLLRTTPSGHAYLDPVHYRQRVVRHHARSLFTLAVVLGALTTLCWRALR
jgi:hypothetical protein